MRIKLLKHNKSFNALLLIIGVAIVLAIFSKLFAFAFIKPFAGIQKIFVSSGTSISKLSKNFILTGDDYKKMEWMQNALTLLMNENAELEILRAENKQLKEQSNYAQTFFPNNVTASIISRSISPNSSEVRIDRGRFSGIDVGDPVIAEQGIMIGKVDSVGEYSSVVRILSDKNSSIASTIMGGTRTIGISNGTGGALLDFNFIPRDAKIEINDIVVTSGLEQSIPRGLVIGLINSVTAKENDPFKKASIEPVVDYRDYTLVTIITGF